MIVTDNKRACHTFKYKLWSLRKNGESEGVYIKADNL